MKDIRLFLRLSDHQNQNTAKVDGHFDFHTGLSVCRYVTMCMMVVYALFHSLNLVGVAVVILLLMLYMLLLWLQ